MVDKLARKDLYPNITKRKDVKKIEKVKVL